MQTITFKITYLNNSVEQEIINARSIPEAWERIVARLEAYESHGGKMCPFGISAVVSILIVRFDTAPDETKEE